MAWGAFPGSRLCRHIPHLLRRSLVHGGAARGGAQQELPARGGGGAAGDNGDSGGTGAAARPGLGLPSLAPWTGLDGACLLLRDLCWCPARMGGSWPCPGDAGGSPAHADELQCHRCAWPPRGRWLCHAGNRCCGQGPLRPRWFLPQVFAQGLYDYLLVIKTELPPLLLPAPRDPLRAGACCSPSCAVKPPNTRSSHSSARSPGASCQPGRAL